MTMQAQTVRLSPPGAVDIASSSLLLDFDGTLVPLAESPDEVVVEADLLDLLARLAERMDGRLAIVSGRSIEQLDRLLGPVGQTLALSGSHGCEHRWNGVDARPIRPLALERVAAELRAFAEAWPGTLLEVKSFGIALHFRRAPEAEAEAVALARTLAEEEGLAYQPGRSVAEIRVAGSDKGVAVARLMQRAPMAGTVPIMLGDDDTDEAAFAEAVRLGGMGVAVGPRPSTNATHALPDPDAVCAWLGELTR